LHNPVPTPPPTTITAGGQLSFDVPLMGAYGWLSFTVPESALITDYCDRAEDRLIEQFEDKQNIKDYLCALIGPLQNLEIVFGDLLTQRRLDVATGDQLDGLGDIVGIERRGLLDNAYRQIIRFQIGINFSNGEAETLIDLTKFVTNATIVNLTPSYPAGVNILTNGTDINPATVQILEESAAAGVKIALTSTFGSVTPFAFSEEPGDVDPDPQGFSEPNYAPDAGLGGELSEKFI